MIMKVPEIVLDLKQEVPESWGPVENWRQLDEKGAQDKQMGSIVRGETNTDAVVQLFYFS